MTETLEMSGDFTTLQEADDASVGRAVIHGMTESFDLDQPGEEERVRPFAQTVLKRGIWIRPAGSPPAGSNENRLLAIAMASAAALGLIVTGRLVWKQGRLR